MECILTKVELIHFSKFLFPYFQTQENHLNYLIDNACQISCNAQCFECYEIFFIWAILLYL
eukprot:c50170_g1_i1 orf=128-310(+)